MRKATRAKIKAEKQRIFEQMVKKMMGTALVAVGVEVLLRKYSAISELDFLLSPEDEIPTALTRLEEHPPTQKKGETPLVWQIDMLRQQAAALCFLADCGQSGVGVRQKVFPNEKGRLFRKVIRAAGHKLWMASGEKENEQPVIAPIVFDDDGPSDTGLVIGRRFFHSNNGEEDGIDGLTPALPVETIKEQRVLALAGLRKAKGQPVKKMILGLAVAPAADWEECIRRLNRMIKEERNS